ncbi:MAG: methyltransferase domain-containing protein [Anaerolineae bacterium]|nr:methyltransferase domain-containing protein [Anaerolineae bacterium]
MRPQDRSNAVDSNYLERIGQILLPVKQRSYEFMQLAPGHDVLDVGCGPGTDTIPLAQLVGESGHVTGMDSDWQMIELARQRAEQAGVADRISHDMGDATDLNYDDDRFDSCRSERVFQLIPAPERVLAEMVRVTRPGGRVVVADADWTTVSIDLTPMDLETRLRQVFVTRTSLNGESGRQLYRLFKEAGLVEVMYDIVPLSFTSYKMMRYVLNADRAEAAALSDGLVTAEELDTWNKKLQQADEAGTFFAFVTSILVAGVKPGH